MIVPFPISYVIAKSDKAGLASIGQPDEVLSDLMERECGKDENHVIVELVPNMAGEVESVEVLYRWHPETGRWEWMH